jgi:hypothetical protein
MTELLLTLLCLAPCAAQEARTFHVSPSGKDDNPGTEVAPLATLEKARDSVRKLVAEGLKSDVKVVIHAGVYELEKTLEFGPQDSGDEKHSINWFGRGEAVISGGRRIRGWKNTGGWKWIATVPKGLTFRRLFVDGVPAVRAREPNISAKETHFKLLDAQLSKDAKTYTIKAPKQFVKEWTNVEDVEIVVHGNWAINRKLISEVDPEAGRLVLAGPHVKAIPWNKPSKGRWSYLENAPEMLDGPEEWYLDRKTGVLSYNSILDRDMKKAVVTAPAIERIVIVAGEPGKPVRNLHFEGLRFAHAKWDLPAFGYQGIQACHFISNVKGPKGRRWHGVSPAIEWRFAESCSITGCVIAHTEGSGIYLMQGCRSCAIVGNHVHDTGANGIMLAGPNDENLVPKKNLIANNYVHHTGADYFGSVGVWCGFVQGTKIVHNLIHDTPYTGLSVGWMWNPQPTACRNNLMQRNHIYNTMKKLADGGCIYTLGFQRGTVLSENHLHDARRGPHVHGAPNNGIFVDEGSKGYLFERNVIYRSAAAHIRFNQCRREWHTWKDNVLGLEVIPPEIAKDALYCEGKTAFDVPHKKELDPEKLTLEAWIYVTGSGGGGDSRSWIANKNDDEWVEGHYGLIVAGNGAGAYINIGGGRENFFQAVGAHGEVSMNKWQHLAMTYDGADLVLYVNGKQAAKKTVNRKRKPGAAPLTIGARQDRYAGGYFSGVIDEVRLYDRALAASEVAKRARSKKQDDLRGVVGRWSFDGMTGKTRQVTEKERQIIKEVKARAGLEAGWRGRWLEKK